MNKLCGISIVRNAVKYDYCIKEAILSLLGVCDYVIVGYVESDDGTLEILKSIESGRLKILYLTEADWNMYNDKYRLSYITNIVLQEADRLGFTYSLYVQADEVLSERSYEPIRKAMAEDQEAYMCSRINLWKSPYYYLDVPQERKPCSTEVIRLAKVNYRAVDDAENIGAPVGNILYDDIVIYHMGFVRKREIMKSKIINMQQGVFAMENYDAKLDQCEVFNPDLWFSNNDLKIINQPLPELIKQWASERVYDDK